jgi:ribosomal protein L11 methyltransferase
VSSFPALDLAWQPDRADDSLGDLLYAALDDFNPVAIEAASAPRADRGAETWRIFFASGAERDAATGHLRTSFRDRLLSIEAVDVADEDWARRSQAGLRAIRIGRIVVSPPWDAAAGGEISIVIDPSTGFGTGHHETTRLCLGVLQGLEIIGRSAIDVGTGSGVLAIAACRLGADRVVALDHDPEALRNARENVARNGCDRIVLEEADLSAISLEPADVVLANLTSAVLQRYAAPLKRLVKDGGVLVVSGFGPAEIAEVAESLAPLEVRDRAAEGEWTALVLG